MCESACVLIFYANDNSILYTLFCILLFFYLTEHPWRMFHIIICRVASFFQSLHSIPFCGGSLISNMVSVSHPDTSLPVSHLLPHLHTVPISTNVDLHCIPKLLKNK